MFARGDGKGFTKEVVDKWNSYFDFDYIPNLKDMAFQVHLV
jgi:hypothetical protein